MTQRSVQFTRRPPDIVGRIRTGEIDLEGAVRMLREHLDRLQRELDRRAAETESALPIDVNDAVRFLSPGPFREFRVALKKKTLDQKPNKWVVIDKRGPGTVWRAKQSLVEGGNLVLMTDAPVGVFFEIVPFRWRPGVGNFELEDEAPPPIEQTEGPSQTVVVGSGQPANPGGKQSWES